ncbi:hypothetical protein AZF37_01435 [endosymbiont 'TC1' of Trimyema compressum]|uniref:transposase n=1 Tax=endosymbiont 'TC1' of Trimyema compressum TaxID=243899 RepID=UPI0007F06FC3|nr:transposase [endosymbiont 'TC1' of Trimyema compressum]AMP20016.1 hypothetical protein AZF37_01435 [endosymbiont 'TC1' of Trimyema compressum]
MGRNVQTIWARRFNNEKSSYSGNFKASVIEYMHDKKLSLFQTAIHFGIPSDSTLIVWKRIYYEEAWKNVNRVDRKSEIKF